MPRTSNSFSNLHKAQVVSAAGMHVQAMRVRVISENVAHGDSTSPSPNVDPYARKTISFANVYDKDLGVELVSIDKIERDKAEFQRIHRPHDAGADKDGYVKKTNVNALIEMMDLREAIQSHDANLKVYQSTSAMLSQTVDAMRG